MRSLVWATDVDVLPADREVVRREGYWVVCSPSNPHHFFGNLLLFDDAPREGDGGRWEALFAAELPGLEHRTFAWDLTDGTVGAAPGEFPGYDVENTVGLVAAPAQLRAHPRANREVIVRTLDPDGAGWDQVLASWEADNAADPDPHPADGYRAFAQRRLGELRALLRAGRGAWFVALDGTDIVASLGVIVTGGRGGRGGRARFQHVGTRSSHRRRGIASRLVVEAAEHIAQSFEVSSFVIAADPDYHALGIYQDVGFKAVERVTAVYRRPA